MRAAVFVSSDDIRASFSSAMSAMYKVEVPAYGTLMEMVADANARVLAGDPQLQRSLGGHRYARLYFRGTAWGHPPGHIRRTVDDAAVIRCCNNEVLGELAAGRVSLAYNVLGSYAYAAARANPALGIVLPRDYTLILSRGALIPSGACTRILASGS